MISGKLYITALLLLISILSGCSSAGRNDASQQQEHKEVRPQPEIPLPPGSAAIEAYLQDFKEAEDKFLCKVKVSEVDGYGPATPPLPVGYVITLDVPKSLLVKNRYEAEKIFIKGKLLKMNVRFQMPAANGGSSERWTATGFSNLAE